MFSAAFDKPVSAKENITSPSGRLNTWMFGKDYCEQVYMYT